MSDTYNTDASDLLTIYHADTAEERSCSQAEFDETFELAGWEIIEPIGDPAMTITVTNPETGEVKSITGAEYLELKGQGWTPIAPPSRAGKTPRRPALRTEDRGRDEGRDEGRR